MMMTIKLNTGLMAAFSLMVAVLFLVCPNYFKNLSAKSAKWISTRKLTKALEIERDVDDKIFNLSKPIGAIALIAAVVLIYLYVTS